MKVLQLYFQAGLIHIMLMDIEFEKVKPHLLMVDANISAANKHVTEVEQ